MTYGSLDLIALGPHVYYRDITHMVSLMYKTWLELSHSSGKINALCKEP